MSWDSAIRTPYSVLRTPYSALPFSTKPKSEKSVIMQFISVLLGTNQIAGSAHDFNMNMINKVYLCVYASWMAINNAMYTQCYNTEF